MQPELEEPSVGLDGEGDVPVDPAAPCWEEG